MARRTNTAVWNTTLKQWKIGVQKEWVRKYFYSGTPGRTGQQRPTQKLTPGLMKTSVAPIKRSQPSMLSGSNI